MSIKNILTPNPSSNTVYVKSVGLTGQNSDVQFLPFTGSSIPAADTVLTANGEGGANWLPIGTPSSGLEFCLVETVTAFGYIGNGNQSLLFWEPGNAVTENMEVGNNTVTITIPGFYRMDIIFNYSMAETESATYQLSYTPSGNAVTFGQTQPLLVPSASANTSIIRSAIIQVLDTVSVSIGITCADTGSDPALSIASTTAVFFTQIV